MCTVFHGTHTLYAREGCSKHECLDPQGENLSSGVGKDDPTKNGKIDKTEIKILSKDEPQTPQKEQPEKLPQQEEEQSPAKTAKTTSSIVDETGVKSGADLGTKDAGVSEVACPSADSEAVTTGETKPCTTQEEVRQKGVEVVAYEEKKGCLWRVHYIDLYLLFPKPVSNISARVLYIFKGGATKADVPNPVLKYTLTDKTSVW